MQNDANKGSLTDKFRDFGAAPTDGLWDSIAAQLDDKKKRRIGFWWWTTGLAALLLVVSGILLYDGEGQRSGNEYADTNGGAKKDRNSGNTEMHTRDEDRRKDGQTDVSADNPDDHGKNDPGTHNPAKPERSEQRSRHRSTSAGRNGMEQPIATQTPSNQHTMGMNGSIALNGNGQDTVRDVADSGNAANTEVDSAQAVPADDLAAHTDSVRGDSSFGLLPDFTHRDPALAAVPKWMIGLRTTRWQDNGREPLTAAPSDGEISMSGVGDLFGSPEKKAPYIHRHWSLEADIAYRFNNRWWLGSGMHVGFFSSDRETVSPALTNARLTGWTIGLPFNLNADIVSRNRWQVYTGLGVNLDFPVRRKLQYEPGSSASAFSIEESASASGYLGSTQLNLGVRYRVWKNLSVDLRPTVRRYFESGDKNGLYVYNSWWWGVAGGVSWQF